MYSVKDTFYRLMATLFLICKGMHCITCVVEYKVYFVVRTHCNHRILCCEMFMLLLPSLLTYLYLRISFLNMKVKSILWRESGGQLNNNA